jgi:hypothetical protein
MQRQASPAHMAKHQDMTRQENAAPAELQPHSRMLPRHWYRVEIKAARTHTKTRIQRRAKSLYSPSSSGTKQRPGGQPAQNHTHLPRTKTAYTPKPPQAHQTLSTRTATHTAQTSKSHHHHDHLFACLLALSTPIANRPRTNRFFSFLAILRRGPRVDCLHHTTP